MNAPDIQLLVMFQVSANVLFVLKPEAYSRWLSCNRKICALPSHTQEQYGRQSILNVQNLHLYLQNAAQGSTQKCAYINLMLFIILRDCKVKIEIA